MEKSDHNCRQSAQQVYGIKMLGCLIFQRDVLFFKKLSRQSYFFLFKSRTYLKFRDPPVMLSA